MSKTLLKSLVVMLMVSVAAVILISNVNIGSADVNYSDITSESITRGASDTTGTADSVQNIIRAILTVTQVIGVGVAVIMLIVLAIKYISAAPGDKADIKKHAVVYVVGAVVLFAASGILQIIKNFAGMVKPN